MKTIIPKEETKSTPSDYGLLTPQQSADLMGITLRSFWTYVLRKEIPRECIIRFGMTVLVDKDCLLKAGKQNTIKFFQEKDARKKGEVKRGADKK